MPAKHYTPSKQVHIGVLFCGDVQLLDLATIDLLAMCSKRYLQACDLPGPLVALGFDDVRFSFIGEGVVTTQQQQKPSNVMINAATTDNSAAAAAAVPAVPAVPYAAPPNTTLVATTCALTPNVQLTHDITSPDVAAGKLDILHIPGPDPATVPSEAMVRYIRAHASTPSTDILCVCTGMFPLARSPGVLDGRKVTGPRPLVDMKLRKLAPKADWDDGLRWVVDRGVETNTSSTDAKERTKAELWSSGGITVGNDMVAAYLREKISAELAELVCTMADVGDRSREYDQGKGAMKTGFVWLLVRSLWRGLWGR